MFRNIGRSMQKKNKDEEQEWFLWTGYGSIGVLVRKRLLIRAERQEDK